MNRVPANFLPAAVLACMLMGMAPPLLAQATTTKPANDKLMTRDELRACFKQENGVKGERQAVTGDRASVDAERDSLTLERDALARELAALEAFKGEGAKVDATNADAVNAYNARAVEMVNGYNTRKKANDATIEVWNGRNATLRQRENVYNDTHRAWKDNCANRRFREDDEKAVRAGR